MKNIVALVESLEGINRCQFASFTYTTKSTGEVARHTVRLGASYREACVDDLTELEIQLRDAKGIRKVVIEGLIASVKESIAAIDENREHVSYTKKGIYRTICPGLRVNLNDNSLEITGFSHVKKVLTPGEYKTRNFRSEETRIKSEIEKTLKKGKFRSYCPENLSEAKILLLRFGSQYPLVKFGPEK